MSTGYCVLGTSVCFAAEVWAAWVQAVGSVAAIVAAVAVVDFQHRKQVQVKMVLERESEIGMCRYAFLAARSYQLAIESYKEVLPSESPDGVWHLHFPFVWIDFSNGGYLPDQLSFLVARKADDVLTCFYDLNYQMREWVVRIERLFKYRHERISVLLEARSRELGTLLNDDE